MANCLLLPLSRNIQPFYTSEFFLINAGNSPLWFFGTFNPIHAGHLAMIQTASKVMPMGSQIYVVPTGCPPHRRQDPDLAEPVHRLAMARLATETLPYVTVLDIEAHEQVSYTAGTLQSLYGTQPTQPICLLMGADMFVTLPAWRQAAWLRKHVCCWVIDRPDLAVTSALSGYQWRSVPMPSQPVSASTIRHLLAQGQAVPPDWISHPVATYIQAHRLYHGQPTPQESF